MVVSITWAESSGGEGVSLLDWGNITAGTASDADTLWLSHDGSSKIYDCAFYIQAFSGEYEGDASAEDDLSEILGWGADSAVKGFLINQVPYGSANWTTHILDGAGTSATPYTLLATTVSPSGTEGEIAVGANHKIGAKLVIPADASAGVRQFDQCLRYTFTS